MTKLELGMHIGFIVFALLAVGWLAIDYSQRPTQAEYQEQERKSLEAVR